MTELATAPEHLPASVIEHRDPASLVPYEKNPRTHSDEQIAQLIAGISKWGFTNPILIDKHGGVLAGHGRLVASLRMRLPTVPVRVIGDEWTEDDKRAYIIWDNQSALNSGWDLPLLQSEAADLQAHGFDLPLLGFSSQELQDHLNSKTAGHDPEATPIIPTVPTSRRGDVWVLGDHRIICGDSTKAETWKALLGPARAHMVFTDPPYGVSYEAPSGAFEIIEGDRKRRDDLYRMLVHAIGEMTRHAAEEAAFYIWHASATREDFADAMKAAGLLERQYLLWVKPALVLGHADYQWQHEPCFYAAKAGRSPAFYGARTESTVWHVAQGSSEDLSVTIGNGLVLLDGQGDTLYVQAKPPKGKKLRHVRIGKGTRAYLNTGARFDSTVWQVARDPNPEHPTQKPVELARRAIENSSRPGEIVIDGFLGSGTTLIGAEMTGRRCYGAEIAPAYVDVAVQRWQEFTGKAAVLESGGRSFAQTAGERQTPAARERHSTGLPAAAAAATPSHMPADTPRSA